MKKILNIATVLEGKRRKQNITGNKAIELLV